MTVALVTGASSGIGAAIAVELARPGATLALLGRNQARLSEVAERCRARGADCHIASIDALDRDGMAAFVAGFDARHPLDLLVASAGIFQGRHQDEITEPATVSQAVLDTNLLATIDLVHLVLPAMRLRRNGRVLLIASLAGLFPLADAPSYSASKAALVSYGLALREALRGEGISVTVACPGFVSTPMVAGHHGPRPGEVTAEVAARRMVKAVQKGVALMGFPAGYFWFGRLYYLLPSFVRRKAAGLFRFHLSEC